MTSPDRPLRSAELCILQALGGTDAAAHGYQLFEDIKSAKAPGRPKTVSTLYRTLARLEEFGLTVSAYEPAPGRGPARRVHTITPAGTAALIAAGIVPGDGFATA